MMETVRNTAGLPLPQTPAYDQNLHASPDAVVDDPELSLGEKRALLASWASDARAVENFPALRRLDNGGVVDIDAVLEALKRLDRIEAGAARPELSNKGDGLKRAAKGLLHRVKAQRRDRDDDDDPPPCPVAARPPQPLPFLDAAAAA